MLKRVANLDVQQFLGKKLRFRGTRRNVHLPGRSGSACEKSGAAVTLRLWEFSYTSFGAAALRIFGLSPMALRSFPAMRSIREAGPTAHARSGSLSLR
jgi:hypothetical protein